MSVLRGTVLISAATVQSGSLLTHHAKVGDYASLSQKHIVQLLVLLLLVHSICVILQYLSAPCSHKCHTQNNFKMGVSYTILKSIHFLFETSPTCTSTFHWSHSCTGYNSRRPLKCQPGELEKQSGSKVSHKYKGIRFTIHQAYPFHKAGSMLHLGTIRD